jgi:phage shock protein C
MTQPQPEWRNMFGVCAAIGEDLGFDPLWLRLAFAVPLIWFPFPVLSAYAALGVLVLASRLLFPNARPAPAEPVVLVTRPVPTPEVLLDKAA